MLWYCLSHCLKVLISAVKTHIYMQHTPLLHPESLVIQNPAQLHPVLLQCLQTYMPIIQSSKSHQFTNKCSYKMQLGIYQHRTLCQDSCHHLTIAKTVKIISTEIEIFEVMPLEDSVSSWICALGISASTWICGHMIVQSIKNALYPVQYIHWNAVILLAVSSAIFLSHSFLFIT